MSKTKEYLGDGVYASFDGYQIELKAEGDGVTNVIYLEPLVMSALMSFAEKAYGVKIKVEKVEEEA